MNYTELVKGLRKQVECDKKLYSPGVPFETVLLDLAADAIEELIKERDMYIKAMTDEHNRAATLAWKYRWIPVTERLPEDDVAVLVTYIGHNSHKLRADLLAYRYDGTWLWVEDSISISPTPIGDVECAVPITHWMPLPEPPKEENDG